jgi:hypothetical protein
MPFVRKDIADALYERLREKVEGVKTWGRRFEPQRLAAEQQPAALVIGTGKQSVDADPLRPPVWTIEYEVRLYVRNPGGDREDDPDDALNDLVDSVETALRAQPGEQARGYWTNLGGVCERAFISGDVEIADGEQAGQGVAAIPISVKVPQR